MYSLAFVPRLWDIRRGRWKRSRASSEVNNAITYEQHILKKKITSKAIGSLDFINDVGIVCHCFFLQVHCKANFLWTFYLTPTKPPVKVCMTEACKSQMKLIGSHRCPTRMEANIGSAFWDGGWRLEIWYSARTFERMRQVAVAMPEYKVEQCENGSWARPCCGHKRTEKWASWSRDYTQRSPTFCLPY